jgi:hypothetical protein
MSKTSIYWQAPYRYRFLFYIIILPFFGVYFLDIWSKKDYV